MWDLPLYAFIASIPFETFGSVEGQALAVAASRVFGSLWAAAALLDPHFRLRRISPAVVAMALFALTLFIRSLTIDSDLLPVAHQISWTLLQMTVMLWLLTNIVSARPYLYKHIAWVYGTSCAALSFLQLLGATSVNYEGSQRISAMGEDPNTLCGKLAVGLVLVVGLVWGRKGLSAGAFIATAFVCLTVIPSILRSGSRGGLLAVVVGLTVLALSTAIFQTGLSRVKRTALMILVAGMLIYGIQTSDLMMSRWNSTLETGDLSRREVLYPHVIEMVLTKPWLGWGPIQNYISAAEATHPGGIQSTENTFGWALTSVGLLGTAPLFYIIYFAGRSAWRLRQTALGWAPMAALSTTLVFSCTVEWHHVKVYWLILGMTIAAAPKFQRNRLAIHDPLPHTRVPDEVGQR